MSPICPNNGKSAINIENRNTVVMLYNKGIQKNIFLHLVSQSKSHKGRERLHERGGRPVVDRQSGWKID